MIKVNLEQEMIKMNSETIAEEELFLESIKDFLEKENENDLEILKNAGFGHLIKKKQAIEVARKNKDNFTGDRVFHIDQIEKIAIKHGLRMLPTKYFEGNLNSEVLPKIKEFYETYPDERKKVEESERRRYLSDEDYPFHIMAPRKSFRLQKRPKDPLLFYKINSDYYYLIHKWGNDLSIFRKMKFFFFRSIFHLIAPLVALFISGLTYLLTNGIGDFSIGGIVAVAVMTISGILAFFLSLEGPDFLMINRWRSKYRR